MAGIVPNAELLNSNAPFGLTFAYMFNDTIANVIMALMIVSCCGALLCWQFTLSRVFKNAAEAGYFPKVFARETARMLLFVAYSSCLLSKQFLHCSQQMTPYAVNSKHW